MDEIEYLRRTLTRGDARFPDQVTEDPELTRALRTAAPHRRALLDSLVEAFDDPAAAAIDWDVLRESKGLAWLARQRDGLATGKLP